MPSLLSLLPCLCLLFRLAYADPPPFNQSDDYDRGRLGNFVESSFATTELKAPRINFQHWSDACNSTKKYVFAIHSIVVGPVGPMVMDCNGHMVWHREDFGNAYNLAVQKYKGKNVLTFWAGDDTVVGHGTGYYYMVRHTRLPPLARES